MKSKFFIDRPILSMAVSLMVTIAGIIGFTFLPVEQFPNIAPPVVNISADYPGASAEAVLKSVIVPIEQAVNGVDNMDYILSSATSSGTAQTSVTFKPGTDPDLATILVKNCMEEAESMLPPEVLENGVHVEKEQQGVLRIIAVECPDNRYDNDFISNYFMINIEPRLKRIKGVGSVQLLGNTYAMRIWMDPKKMAFYELEPSDIEEALNGQNIEAAIGTLGEDSKNTFQYTLVYRGRLSTPEEFENIVLKSTDDGAVLRLGDVARCELGTESYANDCWVNSHQGTVALISQTSGSNARQINREIDLLLEDLQDDLPPGLEFHTLLNTNTFLDASIHEVDKTLLEAILLVVIVVLVFLQNGRATLIPTVAIIMSLVGTFAFIYIAGFSLNLITLFALVLVIGTVVDDAIVVVEAVQTEFDKGERSVYQATLKAMGNIGTAVITTTIVFMCVFLPTSFMTGLSGTYYQQFGLTMAVAVALSTLNALTLSPALCAMLLKSSKTEASGKTAVFFRRFSEAFNNAFNTMAEKYQRCIGSLVRHPWAVGATTLAAFALLFFLGKTLPTSLVPDEDTGNVFIDITTAAGSTLEQTKKTVLKVSDAIKDIEEIEECSSVAGWNLLGDDGANTGLIIMKLAHWDDRPGSEHDIDAVIEKVEQRIAGIKSANMFTFALPTVTGYGYSSEIELYVEDYEGGDIDKLKEVTDRFVSALEEREEIGEAYCSYEINFPQYTVTVDANVCKRYGVEPAAVLSVLNGYVGGNYASHLNRFGKFYHVMLQADPDLRADVDDLKDIFVVAGSSSYFPITELITLKKSYGLQSLTRFNLYSSISVNISPEDGYSTGEAIAAIKEVAHESLPQGYGYEYTGTTREEMQSASNTIWIFFLCIGFVYLVLCSLYESLFIPLAVLLSVPFGLLGSFGFAAVFGIENNIYMQVGIIMMIGLLSKTSILLTEYASERRKQGLSIRDAALEAAKTRLRPILMTALTLIIGLLPMAFASGAGAVGNMSLGLCVIGGMLVGTVSLLFFVPVFFMFFQHLEEKYIPRRARQSAILPVAVCALLTVSGCGTYSNYQRQTVAADSLLRTDHAGLLPTVLGVPQGWRDLFVEPALVALIEQGLAHNNDLNIAKLHVDAAKAALRNAKGDLFPSLELGASGETARFKNSDFTQSEQKFNVGAEASWEVDIFGKRQNAKKAAAATVEEKQAYVQAVQVELIATVATSYYQLEMYDSQITETRDIIESWKESIAVQKALLDVGEATSDEVSQAEAGLLEAETTLEELQMQLRQAENALCALVGRPSGQIVRGDFLHSIQQLNLQPAVGIQSLTARPDIRQAEAELKRAFYATNEARASLYPSLSLSGSVGWTNDAGEVVSPAGLLARALASLTQPVFANGSLKAAVRQAQAEQEEARLTFVQTVLDAGKEVNDMLASQQYAQRAIDLNTRQVEKLTDVLATTELRMRHDSDVNYLQVLLARQSLLEARLSLLSNRYALVESAIGLYRALGGGSVEK